MLHLRDSAALSASKRSVNIIGAVFRRMNGPWCIGEVLGYWMGVSPASGE